MAAHYRRAKNGEDAGYAAEQVRQETSRRIAESFQLISKSRTLMEETRRLIREEPVFHQQEDD